jgi:hypothetical protein
MSNEKQGILIQGTPRYVISWNMRDGWRRRENNAVYTKGEGLFTLFLSNWERVDGKYGTQTLLYLETSNGNLEVRLYLKGDLCPQLDKLGTGMWTFTSLKSGSRYYLSAAPNPDAETDLGVLRDLGISEPTEPEIPF